MTAPTARPSTPSGLSQAYATKATDHELQKYDNFTRYGQFRLFALSAVAPSHDAAVAQDRLGSFASLADFPL